MKHVILSFIRDEFGRCRGRICVDPGYRGRGHCRCRHQPGFRHFDGDQHRPRQYLRLFTLPHPAFSKGAHRRRDSPRRRRRSRAPRRRGACARRRGRPASPARSSRMPSRRAVRMTRQAISPRLAIKHVDEHGGPQPARGYGSGRRKCAGMASGDAYGEKAGARRQILWRRARPARLAACRQPPLRDFVDRHRRLFVLTGAGCSVNSGIPDYRDADGAWKRSPPVTYPGLHGRRRRRAGAIGRAA